VSGLRIDPRLEATLPPHDDKHSQEFEKMIVDHGIIINPILTWRGLIVDGHNRFRVATKHGIPYETKAVFDWCQTIEEVQFEMRRMQAYSRNLTPHQRAEQCVAIVSYLTGKGMRKIDAADVAANAIGVTRRQVFRNIGTAKVVAECAEKLSDEVKSVAPAVVTELPVKDLKTLANLPHADQEAIIERNDGDIAKIQTELKRSRAVPAKEPDDEVFGDPDPRQAIKTVNDAARLAKRPLLDSITDAMQSLGTLNKHIAACKSLGSRDYNDCRFAMKTIDHVLERWLEDVQASEGVHAGVK